MAMALTVVLATLPNFHPEGHLGFAYSWQLDVLIHAVYYFLLTLLLRYLVFKQRSVFLFASILFTFSLILELIQAWIPRRSLTLMDMFSNLIGIISGIIALYIFETAKAKKNENTRLKTHY